MSTEEKIREAINYKSKLLENIETSNSKTNTRIKLLKMELKKEEEKLSSNLRFKHEITAIN